MPPLDTTPSPPAGGPHPRRRGRWVAGAGLAAFAGVLIFLSVQLWRGRDPVVGGGDGRPGAPAARAADASQRVTTRTSGDAPAAADADPIESFVGSLLGGGSGDHGDNDDDDD